MNQLKKLELRLHAENKFTNRDLSSIIKAFKPISLEKNEVFIEYKSTKELIGFLSHGILKAVEPINDEENIHYFIFDNHFFSEANILIKSIPARLCIKAATACEILMITKNKLQELIKITPILKEVFLEISQKELLIIQQAYYLAKIKEASKRYEAYLTNSPKGNFKISNQDIASYLGITPSSFSRIKKLKKI